MNQREHTQVHQRRSPRSVELSGNSVENRSKQTKNGVQSKKKPACASKAKKANKDDWKSKKWIQIAIRPSELGSYKRDKLNEKWTPDDREKKKDHFRWNQMSKGEDDRARKEPPPGLPGLEMHFETFFRWKHDKNARKI